MKTPYALGLIFLFILAIFLWEFPFSKTINQEIPAIVSVADAPYPYEMSESGESEITYTNKPTVIHINGKVSRKLFRQPEFDVQITADGFDWLKDGSHVMEGPLVSQRKSDFNMGSVMYDKKKKNPGTQPFEHLKTAMIFFDDDFERVYLWTSTEDWMGEAEPRLLKITGPAQNKQEAEQVLRDIHEIYGDLMSETEL